MTELLRPTPDGIAAAAELLRAGRVVAFPTDTVYGVGIAASRADRLRDLFALKERPPEKRIPILVADLAQAIGSGWEADDRARTLCERFWPGALTVVLPRPGVPSSVEGATQAFRAPDHAVALALIRAAGPILATSANISGQPDTLGADEVLVAFAAAQDALAAVVDGGRVPGGVASSVVDLSITPARMLREGPVTRDELAELVDIA